MYSEKEKETIMDNKEITKTIESAITALQMGNPIIVVDDKDRENEGDLIYAAETVTEEKIAFMLQHTSGIICVPCYADRLDKLRIPIMVQQNTSRHGCAFTVSVDAKDAHTGVSAADRVCTIQKLVNSKTTPEEIVQPGHIFPLRADSRGVLRRAGHTEAAVDLCHLAKLQPIAVLAELMNLDGTMMRFPDLHLFATTCSIPIISIANLISYRLTKETLILRQDTVHMPTAVGDFTLTPFQDTRTGAIHLALVKGNAAGKQNVLVRVHSECLTGDVFASQRCDCGDQLLAAMQMIEKEGVGVVLYMRQEGRGIGLLHKLQAYHLQEKGFDTVEANTLLGFPPDLREYGTGAQILLDLGLTTLRLLTNNPKKVVGLEGYGLQITERLPLEMPSSFHNKLYMQTKKEKLGHLFDTV